MKKVEILASYYEENLTRDVNNFLLTHNVTDIQFQASGGSSKVYAVMIVYEE